MSELFRAALPLLPFTLLPAVLFAVAPLCGRRTRTFIGAALLLAGLGFVVDVLVKDHSGTLTLEIPNVFPRGPEGKLHVWTVAHSSAPQAHYHYVLAVALALPGVWLLLRRGRAPQAPQPALHGTGIFLYYLALRLALEHTATHIEIVWATGATAALALLLPFVGWYAGARGHTFVGLVKQLLVMSLYQRVPLIVFAYFATTRALGTHLDTHLVTDMNLRPLGEVRFDGDAMRAWTYTTLIPHLTVWILMTLVSGILLGGLPFLIARSRARRTA